MATHLRRFTISITPSMETDLDDVKKAFYYNRSQSEMIRDLISRGLVVLISENPTYSKDDRSV